MRFGFQDHTVLDYTALDYTVQGRSVVSLFVCTSLIAVALLLAVNSAHADTYASGERSQAAIGHYAKARALLVEALGEFEQGRRLAQPDLLLDAEMWRLSVVSRAEDLNRVLDPKPRVTRSGARFKASPKLIRDPEQPYRPLSFGPKDSNTYGETQRAAELEAMRARLGSEPAAEEKIEESEPLKFEGDAEQIPNTGATLQDVPEASANEAMNSERGEESVEAAVVSEEAAPIEQTSNENNAAPEAEVAVKDSEQSRAAVFEESQQEVIEQPEAAVGDAVRTEVYERLQRLKVGSESPSSVEGKE